MFCSGYVGLLCSRFNRNSETHPPHIYFYPSIVPRSEGCASAVKRILSKCDGVEDVQTNVEAKTVVVVTADDSVSPQVMLEKLQKVRAGLGWSARSDSQAS